MAQGATPRHEVPLRTLVAASVAALPIAILSLGLFWLIEHSQHLVWHDLPEAAGWSEPPSWFVLVVPLIGGALTALAMTRVPKADQPHDGGMGMNPAPPKVLAWLLVAAVTTLGSGIVLGPEAPMLALGLTLGAITAKLSRQPDREAAAAVALAGAFTALSTVFGAPFVALLLVMELVATNSDQMPASKLVPSVLPGFLAAGIGALTFTGVARVAGVDVPSIAIPDLPAYDTVHVTDVVWMVPVAAGCALLVQAVHSGAHALRAHGARLGMWLLPVAGLLVGTTAVVTRAVSDADVADVLFSGETAMPTIVAIGSVGTLVAVAIGKTVAYTISLGAGFEGGPIFPAIAISAAIGTAASIALPGAHLTPMLAVSIAAGSCAVMRLPLFGTVLAAVLLGSATVEVMPLVVLASVIGLLATAPRHSSTRGTPGVVAPDPAPAPAAAGTD